MHLFLTGVRTLSQMLAMALFTKKAKPDIWREKDSTCDLHHYDREHTEFRLFSVCNQIVIKLLTYLPVAHCKPIICSVYLDPA